MALNFNPELVPTLRPGEAPRFDDAALKRNQRAVAAHLDDLAYVRTILPAMCFADGGAALGGSEALSYITFPDAGTTARIRSQIVVPPYWRNGVVRFTILYGGSVGSTNNIRFRLHHRVLALDADYTVTDASTLLLAPGPATANTWTRATFAVNIVVLGSTRIVGFRIIRDGADAADTYAGTVHLLAVVARFVPALQEATLPGREAWWEA